jgi:hypothetical protein
MHISHLLFRETTLHLLGPSAVRSRVGDAALEGAAVLEHLPHSIGAAEYAAVLAIVVGGEALELTLPAGLATAGDAWCGGRHGLSEGEGDEVEDGEEIGDEHVWC